MGDLNSDLLSKNTAHGKKLKEVIKSNRLENVIKEPTRITDSTKTSTDVLIVSNKDNVILSGIIDVGLADHRMTYCILRYRRKSLAPCIRLVTDHKSLIR